MKYNIQNTRMLTSTEFLTILCKSSCYGADVGFAK